MKQLEVGVSGTIVKSHEENGITVIDEFAMDGASIIGPDPFAGPLTEDERKDMNRELDRIYRTSTTKAEGR